MNARTDSTHAHSGRRSWWFALLCGSFVSLAAACDAVGHDVVFDDVILIDGSGAAARVVDVAIRGGVIAEIGGDLAADIVIDGGDLVLAPGFIDTHSHHDRGLEDAPDAVAAVSQGITTIVVGQDGGSAHPLADFFARLTANAVAINVASFSGHNTLRDNVMGDDFRRAAAEEEIDRMGVLLEADLAAGALGLSTGLEYDPGIYATTDEVVTLARVASNAGGRYASHIRSEDRRLLDALEEAILIGREADVPVHISHLKLAMRSLFGRAGDILALLDSARSAGIEVTADVYPYEYWQSTMTVLFPERDLENRAAADFALTELTSPEGMIIAQYDPDTTYVGLTLAQIAEQRGQRPAAAYLALIAESQAMAQRLGRSTESVIARSMHEDDIATLLVWPHSNVCTDGGLRGRHPRGFGSFPRVLRQLVRERGVMSLEEAIRSMTSQAADNVGIRHRGRIAEGAPADLVLFDPDSIADRATPEDPNAISVGIHGVWVNGIQVWDGESATGARPGVVIRRAGDALRLALSRETCRYMTCTN